MIKSFATVPELGELDIIRVLTEYDFPLVFVCRNAKGSLYLFNESDEDDKGLEYQVFEISQLTYDALISERTELQDVIDQNKANVFKVRIDYPQA